MQAYEKLHKLIVEYVCKKDGLDRAISDEYAGDEVRAAVESVFPLSSLARFLTLEEAERLQQIEELSRITLGICLFNRSGYCPT
jgi:dihydrodipicolinate synthase/N-acetylneuraminate lyase